MTLTELKKIGKITKIDNPNGYTGFTRLHFESILPELVEYVKPYYSTHGNWSPIDRENLNGAWVWSGTISDWDGYDDELKRVSIRYQDLDDYLTESAARPFTTTTMMIHDNKLLCEVIQDRVVRIVYPKHIDLSALFEYLRTIVAGQVVSFIDYLKTIDDSVKLSLYTRYEYPYRHRAGKRIKGRNWYRVKHSVAMNRNFEIDIGNDFKLIGNYGTLSLVYPDGDIYQDLSVLVLMKARDAVFGKFDYLTDFIEQQG